jgi:hypothetical protein
MAKGRGNTVGLFIAGLMVVVLLILSGILSAILTIPVYLVAILSGMPQMLLVATISAIVISILVLGWVFTRFKVRRK